MARNVSDFLAEGHFLPGLEQRVSSTYLLLDQAVKPPLVGYVTLTFDSVRLTNAEKREMEELFGIGEFGALRIQMIGVDHHHQSKGYGTALLEGIAGLARRLSHDVALRFLLADANVRKVKWYEAQGFVATGQNESAIAPTPSAVSRCAWIFSTLFWTQRVKIARCWSLRWSSDIGSSLRPSA